MIWRLQQVKRWRIGIFFLFIILVCITGFYVTLIWDRVPNSPSNTILQTAEYLQENPYPVPSEIAFVRTSSSQSLCVYANIDLGFRLLSISLLGRDSISGYFFRINGQRRSFGKHQWSNIDSACVSVGDLNSGLHLIQFVAQESGNTIIDYTFTYIKDDE